jgi:hypothetical protein
MTLQQSWEKEAKANAVTKIFGYSENSTDSYLNVRRSAIPDILDEWFHGDFKDDWSTDLESTTGSKQLDEYTSESFPEYRINSVIEIGFNTDGRTIPDSEYEVRITDPADDKTSGGLAPVTLEGEPEEPDNPFRNEFDHYDDGQPGQYLPANQKGPHRKHKGPQEVTVKKDGQSFDGVRGSIIFGGSDKYLEKLKDDGEKLASLTNHHISSALSQFAAHLSPFYTFLDFAFIADGAKAVRVWDASPYPAHALYVDGDRKRQSTFRKGIEWTVDGPVLEHTAFHYFALEGLVPGYTPFGQGGSFGYRNFYTSGRGDHPVMVYAESGSSLSGGTVENELSNPLFPDNVDNPI